MSEDSEEYIELNKLKPRELLILLHKNGEDIKAEIEKLKASNQDLVIKVNQLETKSKVWGGVVGFFASLSALVMEKMLNR